MGILSHVLFTIESDLLIDINLIDLKTGNRSGVENRREEAESHCYCCRSGQRSIWLKGRNRCNTRTYCSEAGCTLDGSQVLSGFNSVGEHRHKIR